MPMIYHLLDQDEWSAARTVGARHAPSLETEGFVHCSFADQLEKTREIHFAGRERLVLLWLDEIKLGDALKVEPSRSGKLFPHVYGPIPLEAVTRVVDVEDEGLVTATE